MIQVLLPACPLWYLFFMLYFPDQGRGNSVIWLRLPIIWISIVRNLLLIKEWSWKRKTLRQKSFCWHIWSYKFWRFGTFWRWKPWRYKLPTWALSLPKKGSYSRIRPARFLGKSSMRYIPNRWTHRIRMERYRVIFK